MLFKGDKNYCLFNFVFISIFVISLLSFIILVTNFSICGGIPDELEEKKQDIEILAMESFKFQKGYTTNLYDPSLSYLGSIDSQIFYCFVGYCIEEYQAECSKTVCTNDDDDDDDDYDYDFNDFLLRHNNTKKVNGTKNVDNRAEISNRKIRKLNDCYTYKYICNMSEKHLDYECSKGCRTGKRECYGVCRTNKIGSTTYGECDKVTHFDYNTNYYCLNNNLILYWKKYYYKKYGITYSYLKDAVKKDEECPIGTRVCGILDKNENKLCVDYDKECPVNFLEIGDEPSKNNYTNYTFKSVEVDGKKIYYSNGFNKTGKIVEGLFVDTDLDINYDNRSCEILDTYNISELIKENTGIYDKFINKYNEAQIKLGKSYLKKCTPGYNHSADLDEIRKNEEIYLYKVEMNKEKVVPKAKDIIATQFYVFLPGFLYLIISFCCLLRAIYYGKRYCMDIYNSKNEVIFVSKILIICLPFIFFYKISIIGKPELIDNLNKANKYYDGVIFTLMIIFSYLFFFGIILIMACFLILYILACLSKRDNPALSSRKIEYVEKKTPLVE